MRKFILGLDEGTTSARSVLYDVDKHQIVDIQSKTFHQYYPESGYVEQDATEILNAILSTSKTVLTRCKVQKEELLGVGLTNQRETIVAWNKTTLKPIYNAIVWQCRRTTKYIKSLPLRIKNMIKEKTGLIADPYFSASKMKWIMDNVKEAKKLAKEDNLCFGTIDAYIATALTGNFVTDTTNASRTMLMNLKTLDWDEELLEFFKIPRSTLPKILPCDSVFGKVKKFFDAPLCAMIGDQQSSMIGQGSISYGSTKVTYGTGGFILTNIGQNLNKGYDKLLLTVASTLGGVTEYAVEGSIYSACSGLNFLKHNLNLFDDVRKTSEMAFSLKDNEGVYFVPAFTGLGAPYWNNDARGEISGITFATQKAHIVRAMLESMAYNTKAVFDEMRKNKLKFSLISVDGGGSNNDFLLQFLADMLNHDVVRSKNSEATVMGAIFVAMLSLKIIDKETILKLTSGKEVFVPKMTEAQRNMFYDGWIKAVKKV